MPTRAQTTIERVVELSGIGLLSSAPVRIRFLPAEPDYGIRFQRIDLYGSRPVPAALEYVVPQTRCTTLSDGVTRVELIEHVMAALAGLQIDNCLVQLNAPEPPGGDGSSSEFVHALLAAQKITLDRPRKVFNIGLPVEAASQDTPGRIAASAAIDGAYTIRYELDYGPSCGVPIQSAEYVITPDVFLHEIAFCRTFVLEAEIQALRAMGYGRHVTADQILVFGPQGLVANELRAENECARHKLLDCIGDFALVGRDIAGTIVARQSGHKMNHQFGRRLVAVCQPERQSPPHSKAA